ncbi:hypothetical protein HON58_01935, partial [Candidatus Peregrinibacteria bacterium]|nr:hypothetical protein [Candidatus Peregrinibacteria bacterium]
MNNTFKEKKLVFNAEKPDTAKPGAEKAAEKIDKRIAALAEKRDVAKGTIEEQSTASQGAEAQAIAQDAMKESAIDAALDPAKLTDDQFKALFDEKGLEIKTEKETIAVKIGELTTGQMDKIMDFVTTNPKLTKAIVEAVKDGQIKSEQLGVSAREIVLKGALKTDEVTLKKVVENLTTTKAGINATILAAKGDPELLKAVLEGVKEKPDFKEISAETMAILLNTMEKKDYETFAKTLSLSKQSELLNTPLNKEFKESTFANIEKNISELSTSDLENLVAYIATPSTMKMQEAIQALFKFDEATIKKLSPESFVAIHDLIISSALRTQHLKTFQEKFISTRKDDTEFMSKFLEGKAQSVFDSFFKDAKTEGAAKLMFFNFFQNAKELPAETAKVFLTGSFNNPTLKPVFDGVMSKITPEVKAQLIQDPSIKDEKLKEALKATLSKAEQSTLAEKGTETVEKGDDSKAEKTEKPFSELEWDAKGGKLESAGFTLERVGKRIKRIKFEMPAGSERSFLHKASYVKHYEKCDSKEKVQLAVYQILLGIITKDGSYNTNKHNVVNFRESNTKMESEIKRLEAVIASGGDAEKVDQEKVQQETRKAILEKTLKGVKVTGPDEIATDTELTPKEAYAKLSKSWRGKADLAPFTEEEFVEANTPKTKEKGPQKLKTFKIPQNTNTVPGFVREEDHEDGPEKYTQKDIVSKLKLYGFEEGKDLQLTRKDDSEHSYTLDMEGQKLVRTNEKTGKQKTLQFSSVEMIDIEASWDPITETTEKGFKPIPTEGAAVPEAVDGKPTASGLEAGATSTGEAALGSPAEKPAPKLVETKELEGKGVELTGEDGKKVDKITEGQQEILTKAYEKIQKLFAKKSHAEIAKENQGAYTIIEQLRTIGKEILMATVGVKGMTDIEGITLPIDGTKITIEWKENDSENLGFGKINSLIDKILEIKRNQYGGQGTPEYDLFFKHTRIQGRAYDKFVQQQERAYEKFTVDKDIFDKLEKDYPVDYRLGDMGGIGDAEDEISGAWTQLEGYGPVDSILTSPPFDFRPQQTRNIAAKMITQGSDKWIDLGDIFKFAEGFKGFDKSLISNKDALKSPSKLIKHFKKLMEDQVKNAEEINAIHKGLLVPCLKLLEKIRSLRYPEGEKIKVGGQSQKEIIAAGMAPGQESDVEVIQAMLGVGQTELGTWEKFISWAGDSDEELTMATIDGTAMQAEHSPDDDEKPDTFSITKETFNRHFSPNAAVLALLNTPGVCKKDPETRKKVIDKKAFVVKINELIRIGAMQRIFQYKMEKKISFAEAQQKIGLEKHMLKDFESIGKMTDDQKLMIQSGYIYQKEKQFDDQVKSAKEIMESPDVPASMKHVLKAYEGKISDKQLTAFAKCLAQVHLHFHQDS